MRRITPSFLLWLLAAGASQFTWRCQAADLSTTNREALARFWQAAEARQRPVTVLSFGDSMADSFRSITYYLVRRLEDRFGIAGYSLINYRGRMLNVLTNGAAYVPSSPLWYFYHYEIPTGAAMWWEDQASPKGVLSDQAGLFYVAQPSGGLLTVSISTNQGPWGPVMTLDGYSPTPKGCYTNLALGLNQHRLRADSFSGTNYIVGSQLLQAHTQGLHVVFADQWGLGLSQVTNVPLAVREPIFAALKPDLIVWHMKESADLVTSNRMRLCEAWWAAACPQSDLLYIGTPWAIWDAQTNNAPYDTRDHNAVVRRIAVQHHRAYLDLLGPGVSYDWLNANGFMGGDGVHLSPAGGEWGAEVLWNDLGFFALAKPRAVSLVLTSGHAQVNYPTATGLTYSLQTSTNLNHWTTLAASPGSGTNVTHTLQVESPLQFFRLKLQP